MIFPLSGYETISSLTNLFFALVIGFCFGFVLEKGGLGNAKKLVAQFLLKDLSVFKIMFSAIVTAMIGLFFLSVSGLLNIELINFGDSYLIPQIIGGLLLGVGFVVSGYCPGTTIVAMASGKMDAVYSFVGLFVGALIFVLFFQWIEPLYLSTHIDKDKLFELFNWLYGTVVFMVIGIAIVGFFISEKIELLSEIKSAKK